MKHFKFNNVARWYVINTNPRQEDRAESNLRFWGIETFLPKFIERRTNPFTGEITPVVKSLFPRYLFAKFDIYSFLHKIRYTRGVRNIVSFGEIPTSVDESIIRFIQSRIGVDGFAILTAELKSGDEVVINEGLFKNLSGIFRSEINDSERIRIFLNCVNYQGQVVVDKHIVTKMNSDQ